MMKWKASSAALRPLVAAAFFSLSAALAAEGRRGDQPAEVEKALAQAGDNRRELEKALLDAPGEQRKGMAFLIANMPQHDQRSLRAEFLLQNVELAYRARKDFPWGAQIPEDIFLNDVLPYANVDEARDPWRKSLYELCAPLVKECKTPAEAAQRLNATIFAKLKVRYSTERKQPHQSPKETIEQGKASCTGLSILLSDACRSVGVPARLAGTPLWGNKSGNHTWMEIWSDGWHFTGAAEPDAKGLDRAWFTGIAREAKKDSPQHAIYAVSFRRTSVVFPLVWAPKCKDVFAENVTDRYTGGKAPATQPKETEKKPDLTKERIEQIDKAARLLHRQCGRAKEVAFRCQARPRARQPRRHRALARLEGVQGRAYPRENEKGLRPKSGSLREVVE